MDVLATEATPLALPESLLIDSPVRAEIEQFLFFEVRLLDDRRYSEWLSLCADDIFYWMPMRRNRLTRDRDRELTEVGELAHFDENKTSLRWRVEQLNTNLHWSEAPPSRTRHLVSNVQVTPAEAAAEYEVVSNFICYRNRLENDVDIWAGERRDVLRRLADRQWQLARRTIILDQNVILSANLSVLF
jgi:3-phenylpropionate/cinnamic acid dioxygenase small subunit